MEEGGEGGKEAKVIILMAESELAGDAGDGRRRKGESGIKVGENERKKE